MLSETLNAMKEQQQQGKPGSGKCNKPGGKCNKPGNGKPSFKSMQQLQEQLNKDMESLKNGKNPNGKEGQEAMSEELAKLAAEQAAIRKQLQELEEELKKGRTDQYGQVKRHSE